MLAMSESVAVIGSDARLVEVEVHVALGGLPTFRLVGLPAKSVMEAEQRTRAALESTGQKWPQKRITANLAPGALRKEGTHFDLSIALGVLAADERIDAEALRGWVSIGELALDGSVRPIRGTLAAAIECRHAGRKGLICPSSNASEAAVIDGIKVIPVESLREGMDFMMGKWHPQAVEPPTWDREMSLEDLSEVRGHDTPKQGLEVAAAGGHNLLMIGSPGSGKTMLARRLSGILPEMSLEESMEVTRVYSVAGLLGDGAGLIRSRPFRSPHQHISMSGLIGGGTGLARPGEASLAHRGVLFMDEMSLFRRDVLESLRGPLEEGVIRLARAGGVVSYPATFSLVAAMNPCPCGFKEDGYRPCSCTPRQIRDHDAAISGPLLDRIDIQLVLDRVTKQELMGGEAGEPSEAVRERVEKARLIQIERYGSSLKTNANVSKRELSVHADLTARARAEVASAIDGYRLTGRGMTRVLRVARTIADLNGSGPTRDQHIIAALQLRLCAAEEGAGR